MNLCNDYRLSLGGAKYARKILKKVIEVGYGEQDSSIMSKIVKNLIK